MRILVIAVSVVAAVVLGAIAAVMILPVVFPGFGHRVPKKAMCAQNLMQISKAFRMYAYDWDYLPTNRMHGVRFLSRSCRLSDREHQPIKSISFVDSLNPYLEKLDDYEGMRRIWACPRIVNWRLNDTPLGQGVTYCMNWYMAEQTDSATADAPNTLLMREMGKSGGSILRPYPSSPPDLRHPRGSGPPVHAFPSEREFGRGTIGPVFHNEGSMVLFADGHVSYRSAAELAIPILPARHENGKPGWCVGNIWLTP